MTLPSDHTFTNPAVLAWWENVPDIHDSGTAFKSWIQQIPREANRLDRKAAHEAIMAHVVPHHPGAQELSVICVLRKEVRR